MTNSKPLLADYLTHMAGALWYQWHHTLANNCNWNAWWTRGYPTPSADASCPGRPPARHRRVWSSPGEERGAGCSNVGPSSSLTSWGQLGPEIRIDSPPRLQRAWLPWPTHTQKTTLTKHASGLLSRYLHIATMLFVQQAHILEHKYKVLRICFILMQILNLKYKMMQKLIFIVLYSYLFERIFSCRLEIRSRCGSGFATLLEHI